MHIFVHIVLAILTAPSIVAVNHANAISSGLQTLIEDSPYGSDFFILNTNFEHQFQFVDLNTKDRELLFDFNTNSLRAKDVDSIDIQGITLSVAFRLRDAYTTVLVIDDAVFTKFVNFVEQESIVALYHACVRRTNINASSVYFEGINQDSMENSHESVEPLFCIERKESLKGHLASSRPTRCRQASSIFTPPNVSQIECDWTLKTFVLPVLNIDDLPHQARTVSMRIGNVYRISFGFSIEFYDDASDASRADAVMLFKSETRMYHSMLRNQVKFIYLVQHDSFCNAAHMRHNDAEVLIRQWKFPEGCGDRCIFFPNSTQNEGRNAAWLSTFVRWPGTVFLYYIFVDGDASLVFRADRSNFRVEDSISSEQLPFRMLEKYLLHFNPAVGFPYYFGWHGDNGKEMQFASNYDHILVAIHHNISRLVLPLETRFDDISWWYGQRIQGFLAAVAFSNQTLQFNALVTENGSVGKRMALLSGSSRAVVCSDYSGSEWSSATFSRIPASPEAPVKSYKKDSDYDLPFLWFMDSLQSKLLDRVLFQQYINLDTKSHYSPQTAEHGLKTDGIFDAAESWSQLGAMFDMQHPYWKHRRIFLRSSGVVMFVSACQYHVDVGLLSADQCDDEEQWGDSLSTQTRISTMHAITKNILPQMRKQNERLEQQQQLLEKLLEEIRSLHATVELLANQIRT